MLFCFADGYQPQSFVGTFRCLMQDSGLLIDNVGQTRTIYTFPHTSATLELLRGNTDKRMLSSQMGISAAMIERHYNKLSATLAADKLA